MPVDAEYQFDRTGGHLALDFVNTVGGMRGVQPREHLHEYGDLLAFARQTGGLGERAAARLGQEARRRPDEAAVALAGAKELREALYRLFLDRAEGRRPRPADLTTLNAALACALPHRRVVEGEGGLALAWEEPAALDAPLWPVLEAAAALLVGDEAGRVRVCGASEVGECSWLFLDRTKAGTKRWCSMEGCGNRAKARRHYRRVKGGEGGEPSSP